MKRYLAIIVSMLLVLGLAAVSYAEDKPEITLGGKILIRGWYFENAVTNLPEDTGVQKSYTTNANLTLDAKVSDNVKGFVELETTSTSAAGDENPNTGLFYWGGGQDTKPAGELYFRQLWIQYTGPVSIKAGHMPLVLGEKQFLNNERFGDDAILLWIDPTDALHIAAGTVKIVEGATNDSEDDLSAYLGLGTYKLNPDTTVGGNLTYLTEGDLDLGFYNFGIHGNGNAAGLTYAAEADIQFGSIGDPENDFSGYALFAKAAYALDPITIRGSLARGSGDDDLTDDDIQEFQAIQGPDNVGALARFVHYTQIYERTIDTAAMSQVISGASRNTGIANTTYLNAGVDYSPMADLSLSLDAFYLLATTTDGAEDLIGDDVSNNVGYEIDLKASYKLAKNLTYFIEAGYFAPGDYYEDTGLVTDDKAVTQAIHGLCLTF
ncbi:MAG: alginate export family protein [Nitrospirota bacterium]